MRPRSRVRSLRCAARLASAAVFLLLTLAPSPAAALPEGCREVLAPDPVSGQMRRRVVCPQSTRREERLERRVRELERRERRRTERDRWDDDGPAVIILPSERARED